MTTLIKPSLLPDVSPFFSEFFRDDDFMANNYFTPRWLNKLPAANVIENDDSFIVELAVPGMTKKDFHVDVENGILKVSCENKVDKSENLEHFTRKEFSYNSFMRTFALPEFTDFEKIKATYQEGILKLTIPKKAEFKKNKKREIAIA